MMLSEWQAAVKSEVAEIRKASTAGKWTPWLESATSQNPSVAFEVAQALYASDRLDRVEGINGPDRHRVFVRWIDRNQGVFNDAMGYIERKTEQAQHSALRYIVQQFESKSAL